VKFKHMNVVGSIIPYTALCVIIGNIKVNVDKNRVVMTQHVR